jgi:hypothetical protein
VRVALIEPEADPPLIVDGDRELTAPIAGQRVQSIAGRVRGCSTVVAASTASSATRLSGCLSRPVT